jgi:hypothetical protein
MDDYLSISIATATRDVKDDFHSLSIRVSNCAVIVLPRLLHRMGEETGLNLIADLSRTQQLVEILETGQLLSAKSSIFSPRNGEEKKSREDERVKVLMNKWRNRLEGCTSTSLLGGSLISLRLSLVRQLLQSNNIDARHSLQLMDHIHSLIRNKSDAHALSPLVYELKSMLIDPKGKAINLNNDSARSRGLSNSAIFSADWALRECKLLWKKGLLNAAKGNLVVCINYIIIYLTKYVYFYIYR